jgi:hypothetical protein
MKVFRHKRHNAYQITKKLVIVKYNKGSKIKFYFKGRGFSNLKFSLYPHKEWRYFHWLIRLPFLYFQKNNGGYEIGFPNCYLWIIK